MTALLSVLHLASIIVVSSAYSKECSGDGECLNTENECLDASAFQRRVASFEEDESVLPLLRGTIDSIVSKKDIESLVKLLPASEFVEAAGYDENSNKDGRAYNAPVAYAGLNLKDLSTSQPSRYDNLLQIREKVRSATEQALGICPGTLLVDFTTISQKTAGGAHRPHADNCLHYFDTTTKKATCDPARTHPYPKRVAASIFYLNSPTDGNFEEGEFYFADRSNGEVDEIVPIEPGKMIYFTSDVSNLHGALPVQRRTGSSDDEEPRRLALAMWYVFDKELEEFVPTYQDSKQTSRPDSNSRRKGAKPKKVYDPNDPAAPKELFAIPIPNHMKIDSLLQSMGTYLARKSQESRSMWKVNMYGEDALHVLFQDHSAMFSLDFGIALDESSVTEYADSSVLVERHTDGRKPASLQYMLQESVMLHGVLDALSKLILEYVKEDEERYLIKEVEKARMTLPARRA